MTERIRYACLAVAFALLTAFITILTNPVSAAGTGSITIVTESVPAGMTDLFYFGDLGSFFQNDGESRTTTDLDAGTYNVFQGRPDGVLLDIDCVGATFTLFDDGKAAAIDLTDGADATCTYTNNDVGGSITVVNSSNGGTGFFYYGDTGSFTLDDGQTDTKENLLPGDYNLFQSIPQGYNLAISCVGGDYDPLGNDSVTVHLDANEDVVCTFDNSNVGGSITVINAASEASTSFTYFGDTGDYTLTDGESRISEDLLPGDYNLFQGIPQGWELDIACTGGTTTPNGSGSVTVNLAEGDDVVCTFDNTYVGGSITVINVSEAGTPFTYFGTFGFIDLEDGQSFERVDLLPGDYELYQGIPQGWELSIDCVGTTTDPLGGDDNAVTVHLAQNEDAVCTFTNTYVGGSITVNNLNSEAAQLGYYGTFGFFDLDANATFDRVDLYPGVYEIYQDIPAGWLTDIACTGATVTPIGINGVEIDLAANEDAVCDFSNTYVGGSITIVADGLDELVYYGAFGLFELANGETEQMVDLYPGDYELYQGLVDGYDLTIDCVGGDSAPLGTDGNAVTVSLDANEEIVCTFSNAEPTDPTPVSNRVFDGLVAYYTFNEGQGSKVYDVSGAGDALDLSIANPANVTWSDNGCGISVDSGTVLRAIAPATKIYDAATGDNSFTVEMWVSADNITQDGPARMMTFSKDTGKRNFTLGQTDANLVGRIRTTSTNLNGMPDLVASNEIVADTLQHVVMTIENNTVKMYIDGVEVYSSTRNGTFSNWDDSSSYGFALANELTDNRDWLGDIFLAAVYDRALNSAEITQNFDEGACDEATLPPPPPELGDTRVITGLVSYYTFNEGTGSIVHDLADNGAPLDLSIQNPANTTWLDNGCGLSVDNETIIRALLPANKILDAAQATDEITLEMWVSADNDTQYGPARMMTFSKNTGRRNFTLGQQDTEWAARLRTTSTSLNGTGTSYGGTVTPDTAQHVVYTRDAAGNERIWVDGLLVDSGSRNGTFSNWDDSSSYGFALANELTQDRGWLGDIFLAAVYDRALEEIEVLTNHAQGACDLDTVANPDPIAEGRVDTGLLSLYTFNEGTGATVADVSGVGTALDLTIADTNAVAWNTNSCGISVNSSTIIEALDPATKLHDGMMATNEVTLEMWVAAANETQTGPSRMMTLSTNTKLRDFTLAQREDDFAARLRTTSTNDNGLPTIYALNSVRKTEMQHVVYTRDAAGTEALFVDGILIYTGIRDGDFSNWDTDMSFALVNEFTMNRTWLGEIYLAATYNAALTHGEVVQNYFAGACH